jgi:hypothetical protein
MKKFLLASTCLLLLASSNAEAADMAVKAPVAPRYSCSITDCNGFYFGADVGNSTGTSNLITAPLVGGIANNGMLAGLHGGYELYNANFVASAELFGTFDFNQNFGMAGIGGLKQEGSYGVLFGVGANLASTFGLGVTGNAPTIPVPQTLLQSLMSPQVKVGYVNRHGQGALASGLQVQALIATNWTFDGKWLNLQYNSNAADSTGLASTVGVTQRTENIFLFGVSKHFAVGS